VSAADQPVLAVMVEVLDNRLNIATREMRGLSNRTTILLPDTANRAGLLHIRSGGRQEAVAPLVKVSLDELRRLHADDDQITHDEMRRAKGTLILGTWQRSLDGAGEASATFALETVRHGSTTQILGWPSVVEPVTIAQVKHAAKTYLDPASLSVVVVGPIAHIRNARHPRWPAALDQLGFQLKSNETPGTHD
jgi:predicted Zn-dependent peptidase